MYIQYWKAKCIQKYFLFGLVKKCYLFGKIHLSSAADIIDLVFDIIIENLLEFL